MTGLCHIVDVTAENPMAFRFELFGSRGRLDGGKDYTNLQLGEYPTRDFVERIAADYVLAKTIARPLVHDCDVILNGYNQIYTRLILPFGRNGLVERLIVAVIRPGAPAKLTQRTRRG